MAALKIVLAIIFIIDCIALVTLVLAQEGKTQGLGSIQGFAETTYWGQIKGRSREGVLKKVTVALSVLFIVLSIVLNMTVF
ncbi:preprotein translocase subunit SecG [Butyrivibrio sp. VCD2006]|uniref:preprotein translocase subunit SecG n=1 Tax=Butyrivibrio sp. VCD2006 TaxID=1280664 RepID=UPI000416D4BE|nr:preprotein translocase subunit SecG [Butyrivibrio sp. VCD2006]